VREPIPGEAHTWILRLHKADDLPVRQWPEARPRLLASTGNSGPLRQRRPWRRRLPLVLRKRAGYLVVHWTSAPAGRREGRSRYLLQRHRERVTRRDKCAPAGRR
jgi:hypothetical protein